MIHINMLMSEHRERQRETLTEALFLRFVWLISLVVDVKIKAAQTAVCWVLVLSVGQPPEILYPTLLMMQWMAYIH